MESNLVSTLQHASERLFHHLFEQAVIGIAIKDFSGQILFANSALCSTLGYADEDLRGMDTSQFIDTENAPNELELFERLHAGMIDSYKLEKRFTRKDGVKIWGRLRVSVLKNDPAAGSLIIAMLEDITDQKAAEDQLRGTKSELQELAARLIQAQDEERHRISRELHDDIGQRVALLAGELHNLGACLETRGRHNDSHRASQLLDTVNELAADIHQLSHKLHSSQLEHLGLCVALKDLVAQLSRQHRVSITLQSDVARDLIPFDKALCLFRVAQEGLNNVIRHSGAERAFIEVAVVEDTVSLTIRDTGSGFDPSKRSQGIGLVNMRERLRIVGGTLSISSGLGQGTEIRAEVNLAEDLSRPRTAA